MRSFLLGKTIPVAITPLRIIAPGREYLRRNFKCCEILNAVKSKEARRREIVKSELPWNRDWKQLNVVKAQFAMRPLSKLRNTLFQDHTISRITALRDVLFTTYELRFTIHCSVFTIVLSAVSLIVIALLAGYSLYRLPWNRNYREIEKDKKTWNREVEKEWEAVIL